MKTLISLAVLLASFMSAITLTAQSAKIEVTGSATINIIPDRITVEIGLEEYYSHKSGGDSVKVKLDDIEKNVRRTLRESGVADSMITVADLGNYRDRSASDSFLMAKRLSVVVTDFDRLDRIVRNIGDRGMTSFQITRLDNSDMARYNREGLKAALDAARHKAEFIAADEGMTNLMAVEIVENGPNYYETPSFSNVAYDSGAGMEGMRRIVRRYSVKVTYGAIYK